MMPDVGPAPDVCTACVRSLGLCDRHHVGILPQLARNIGWLKLMGEARVEQKRCQSKVAKSLPVSDEQAAHIQRKHAARTAAASKAARGANIAAARRRSLLQLAA